MSKLNQATTPSWRISSACSATTCVAVASDGRAVLVRNSQNPAVTLRLPIQRWHAFLHETKKLLS
jgi:uncharacterized protein DUF397